MRLIKAFFSVFFTYCAFATPARDAYKEVGLAHLTHRPRTESETPLIRNDLNEHALDKLELAIGLEEAALQKSAEADFLHSQAQETILEAVSSPGRHRETGFDGASERSDDPLLEHDPDSSPYRAYYEYSVNPELHTAENRAGGRRHVEPIDRQYYTLNSRQPLESVRLSYLRDLLRSNKARRLPSLDEFPFIGVTDRTSRVQKRHATPQFEEDWMWISPSQWRGYPRPEVYPMKSGRSQLLTPESVYPN